MGRLQDSLRGPVQKPPSFTLFADSWARNCLLVYQKKGSASIFFPGTVAQLESVRTKSRESPAGV